MVFQDGQAFKDVEGGLRAQNVMDNLIYRREIPVMIGVFINPGRRPTSPSRRRRTGATATRTGRPSTTRSTTSTRASSSTSCCRCCTRITTSRRTPSATASAARARAPSRRSPSRGSGPNDFRKVLSIVGSFVNLARAATPTPTSCRKSEKKPIRVFLQDGRNDNRGVGRGGAYDERRDWFYQNVRLMQALTEKGYDVNYAWGMNTHGQKYGRSDPAGDDALAVARPSRLDRSERHGRAVVQRAQKIAGSW